MTTAQGGGTVSGSDTNLEFRSILHIRQRLPHERDKTVALEALDCGKNVVLHPQVIKDYDAIAGNTLSSAHDEEFYFDKVLPATSTSEAIYAEIGQPLALQAMVPLKSFHCKTEGLSHRNSLVVYMGLEKSGSSISYSGSLLRRQQESDGTIPRILDSLYTQSKHHIKHVAGKKTNFGVSITILQVNQSNKNPSDCQIFDLLAPSGIAALSNVRKGLLLHQIVDKLTNSFGSHNSSCPSRRRIGRYEQVNIQQNPETMDSHLTNVVPCISATAEIAREILNNAMKQGQYNSDQNYKSHILINLQPILRSAHSGRNLRRGSNITLLDIDCKARVQRCRDPPCADAHAAILHCLKTMQVNQEHKVDANLKVPYLHHPLTMFLQPIFASTKLSVTIMVTMSQSSIDYMEKKGLLSEMQRFNDSSLQRAVLPVVSNCKAESDRQSQSEAELQARPRQSTIVTYAYGTALTRRRALTLSKSKYANCSIKSPTSLKENRFVPLPLPRANVYSNLSFDGSPSIASHATAPTEAIIHTSQTKKSYHDFFDGAKVTETSGNSFNRAFREQSRNVYNCGDIAKIEKRFPRYNFSGDNLIDDLCSHSKHNMTKKSQKSPTRDGDKNATNRTVDATHQPGYGNIT
jgi:Kinesin motor domain